MTGAVAKPLIVPIFLPQMGCQQRCIFCNQTGVTGAVASIPGGAEIRAEILRYRQWSRSSATRPVELAYFGGSFSGLPETEQERLLEAARVARAEGLIQGLRLSVRPDGLSLARVAAYRAAGVSLLEIGAQSLDDEVLAESRRDHSVADVTTSVALAKAHGMQVVLQLMLGLPGETRPKMRASFERVVLLAPDAVRIHPTLVLAGTELAQRYRQGRYRPPTLTAILKMAPAIHLRLLRAGIPVIRYGLALPPEVRASGVVMAGVDHPNLQQLILARLFRAMAAELLGQAAVAPGLGRHYGFTVHPAEETALRGIKNKNFEILMRLFHLNRVALATDTGLPKGQIVLSCVKPDGPDLEIGRHSLIHLAHRELWYGIS